MQKLSYFWSDLKKYFIETKANPIYKHWLTDIEFLKLSNKDNFYQLQLKAPSDLHRKWFQEHLLEEVCHHFKNQHQGYLQIQMKVSASVSYSSHPCLPHPLPSSAPTLKTELKKGSFLFNPLLTFENFVPGQNAELAYRSSLNVGKHKSALDTMNPLFIYGPSGLGKTHLLNAIGQESLKRFPQRKVLYISGERFLNEYLNALQNNKTDVFRNKFRKNCNLLLIDDIHILARGKAVQEEFFHTFNELYNKKTQVVVCSDQSPHYINSLQERIKTRLAGGLMADISYPDFETRLAILKKKIQIKNLLISKESLKLISKNCQSSIREMEGLLNKVKMITEMKEGKLSFSDLERILQGYKKELNVLDIKKKTALLFKVTLEEMDSPSRKKTIVRARQTAMYLTRKLLKKSLKDICQNFGKKDHTTVLNSIKKVESSLIKDKEFQSLFQLLKQELEKEFQGCCL